MWIIHKRSKDSEENGWYTHGLTKSELEHARWAVEGKSVQQIAQRRGTKLNTEKNHRQNIFRKLRVKTMVQAAVELFKKGVVWL